MSKQVNINADYNESGNRNAVTQNSVDKMETEEI